LIDPALHGVDIGDGGKIEATPPDEGANGVEKGGPEGEVAGDRARLDHGGAFPVLSHALVIGDGGWQRDGRRSHCRVWAQPEIGAKYIAVGVASLHESNK